MEKKNIDKNKTIKNNKLNKLASNNAEQKVRLQKFLAEQGVASRRAAEQIITEGRVRVNGKVVSTQGVKIDPNRDKVKVDGQDIGRKRPRLRYILLYKPAGYICSVMDERKRRTVMDLLVDVEERVYPVGRLDYNTSGLLLLTNDGALTHKLLHPSHQIEKTYLAEVEGIPDRNDLMQLRRGIQLEDGMTAPAGAEILKRSSDHALLEIKLHEGRNRQVRRMLDAIHHPVSHLKRSGLAFLTLDDLRMGKYRELSKKEIERLKEL